MWRGLSLYVGLMLALSARAETKRFALVVGVNRSDSVQAQPLLYADDDAIAMHELLLEAGVESVLLTTPDEDTRRLHPDLRPEGPASEERLKELFEAQRLRMERAHADGNVVEWLFFFSGHGDIAGGEGFLGLERGRLSRSLLHEGLIARVPADHIHIIIDACRSALMVSDKGPGGQRERLVTALASHAQPRGQVGFVVSASSDRESHEWERFQSGVFSYEVRSALRGAADADGDGRVSYAELGAFLRTANLAIPSPAYRPDFLVVPPGGPKGFGVALLSWKDHLPAVTVDSIGHVYVERSSGERLLDVNCARGYLARLYLPAERPLFIQSADKTGERVLTAGAPTTLSALAEQPPFTQAKGALHVAFQRLFADAFGAKAVDRWAQDWTPPFDFLETKSDSPEVLPALRTTAAWTALGTGAAGALALGMAHVEAGGGSNLSQAARVEHNEATSALNDIGVGALIIAGAAAATWAGLRIANVEIAPTMGGPGLALAGTW
jgi:hypothetical protein